MPACEPVNERASAPRSEIAIATQGHRDALAGGEQHVQLAGRRQRGDLLGEVEQLVGGVAHRGHDDDHVVAGLLGVDDPPRDPLDAGCISDAGSAVFLHDEGHDSAV